MKTLEPGIRLSVTARTSIVMDAWSRQQRISVHGWIYAIDNGLLRDLGVSITRPAEAPQQLRRGGQESRSSSRLRKNVYCSGAYESSDRNFAVLHGNSQIPRGIFDFYTELLNSASLFEIPHRISKFRSEIWDSRLEFSISTRNFGFPDGILDFQTESRNSA